MDDYENSLHGMPPQHLQRSWREVGGDGYLEVKNSFLTVSDRHKPLPRSTSWSCSSSVTSGEVTSGESSSNGIYRSKDNATEQPPAHVRFEVSDSLSGSSSTSLPVRTLHEPETVLVEVPQISDLQRSELHEIGKCSPCLNLIHGSACNRGKDCPFCHLSHDDVKRVRRRPCKTTRERCKRTIDALHVQYKDDPETLEKEMQKLLCKHPYMRNLVLSGASSASHIFQSAVSGREQDKVHANNSPRNLVSL